MCNINNNEIIIIMIMCNEMTIIYININNENNN